MTRSSPGTTRQGTESIAIVICTFHRPDLLRQCLDSIAMLHNPEGVPLSVVVVDNSDEGTALPLIEAMKASMPFPLHGIAAHPPNISIARNAGVAAASYADVIAFVDDDQRLTRDWLVAVSKGLRELPHDALLGGVEAEHERPDLAGPTARMLFARDMQGPRGSDIIAMGPKKTKTMALATNNSIFRREATLMDEVTFDPAFGHGGGEDYDLFCRLERRGKRFGWLPEAKAIEFVPASRCNPDYIAGRLFAGGQAFAKVVAKNSENPFLVRWRHRLIGLAQLCLLAPTWLRHRNSSPEQRAEIRFRIASAAGKLSFGDLVPIYRKETRS